MSKAIILLSGGIDSAVCAGIAHKRGYQKYGLTFDYGQTHLYEIRFAEFIANRMQFAFHRHLQIQPLQDFNPAKPVVPGRNTIFLSYALGWAEIIGAETIYIGFNADDTAFPDCSLPYLMTVQSMAAVLTNHKVTIEAPLLALHKKDIIKKAIEFSIPLDKTLSCYNGNACGRCSACNIRLQGFKEAGIPDPINYRIPV